MYASRYCRVLSTIFIQKKLSAVCLKLVPPAPHLFPPPLCSHTQFFNMTILCHQGISWACLNKFLTKPLNGRIDAPKLRDKAAYFTICLSSSFTLLLLLMYLISLRGSLHDMFTCILNQLMLFSKVIADSSQRFPVPTY